MILLSIFVQTTGFFLWLYVRERRLRRHPLIYCPHEKSPPLYPPKAEAVAISSILRFYFRNARYHGFAFPESYYSAFVAGWNSAALWFHRYDQPCPVCGHKLDIRFAEKEGCISATLRCPGCDSSIGWPELSVVYRGDEESDPTGGTQRDVS
jgi:hypothetical protein